VTAVPGLDPTSSGAFILVNFARKMALIGALSRNQVKFGFLSARNYPIPDIIANVVA
jgi:hypothetical protein